MGLAVLLLYLSLLLVQSQTAPPNPSHYDYSCIVRNSDGTTSYYYWNGPSQWGNSSESWISMPSQDGSYQEVFYYGPNSGVSWDSRGIEDICSPPV